MQMGIDSHTEVVCGTQGGAPFCIALKPMLKEALVLSSMYQGM